jgi:hypothetical protein
MVAPQEAAKSRARSDAGGGVERRYGPGSVNRSMSFVAAALKSEGLPFG